MITLGLSPPAPAEIRSAITLNSPSVPLGSPSAYSILSLGDYGESPPVSPQGAMATAAVNASVTLLSTSLAAATPRLYERVGNGRTEAFSNRLHNILAREPNPESTAFQLWSSFFSSALLWGNGFIEIQCDGTGTVQGLWFLPASSVSVVRQSDGTLIYRVTEGMTPGQYRQLPSKNVLHLPAHYSVDGVLGISPVSQCRLTISGIIGMDRYQDAFFRNGATPSGIITSKHKVKPEDKTKMRDDWEQMHSGRNARRTAVLDQEMVYMPIGTPQSDAEWIASRKMAREDVAGIFGLKTSQIASESRISSETYSGQQLSYLTDTLLPWILKWRQECERKLLSGLPQYEIRMDTSERQKLDFKTMMDAFSIAREQSIMTANECRAHLPQLNLNPAGPEGDILTMPAQMVAAKFILNPPKPTTTTETIDA